MLKIDCIATRGVGRRRKVGSDVSPWVATEFGDLS